MQKDPRSLDSPAPGTSPEFDTFGGVLAAVAVVMTLLTLAVAVFR